MQTPESKCTFLENYYKAHIYDTQQRTVFGKLTGGFFFLSSKKEIIADSHALGEYIFPQISFKTHDTLLCMCTGIV